MDQLPIEEQDPSILNKKLIDQILKLKMLINDNRKALEGDNLEDEEQLLLGEDDREEFEKQEKEKRDREKKVKEVEEKLAKE